MEESSTLVLTCRRGDYSASRIARAVEDADAHLLNLNVTADSERSDSRIEAELRISHSDPDADDDSLMRSRYDELMRYLQI